MFRANCQRTVKNEEKLPYLLEYELNLVLMSSVQQR